MRKATSLLALAGAAGVLLSVPTGASAADIDVHVYRPPVYVAPAARVVTVTPSCVRRTVRVWVDGHWVYRTVRRCA